jgi:hypothetical protein
VGEGFCTASGTVTGFGGGVDEVFAGGAGGSDFGEHAATRATPNSGVMAIKRLRVGKVVMSIFLQKNFWNFPLGIAANHPGRLDLIYEGRYFQSGALVSVQSRTVQL